MNLLIKVTDADDVISQIETLLLTRQYSAKQIGRLLGRSKGSIMGYIWRTPRLKEIGLPNPPALPRKAKYQSKPDFVGSIDSIVEEGPLPLVQLKEMHCRFPLWSHFPGPDEPRLFCAEIKSLGNAYCEKHHKLCTTTPRPSRPHVRTTIKQIA